MAVTYFDISSDSSVTIDVHQLSAFQPAPSPPATTFAHINASSPISIHHQHHGPPQQQQMGQTRNRDEETEMT
jgi:hypothetical protein